ncbi:MAG: IS21-like element helper ATPase IstB [Minisyncoccales bacterium]
MIPTIGPADRKELQLGLKRLKLRWIRDHLDELSELALQEEPSYLDYLAYLVKEEVRGRDETQVRNALKAARFPTHKSLNDFDFSFQTSVSRQTVRDLASLEFVRAHENLILLGPPGVGKSHLAIALGIRAVEEKMRVRFWTAADLVQDLYSHLADGSLRRYIQSLTRYDLLVVDELGYLKLDQTASDHLFQLVADAYERASLIITSNLDFREWAEMFANPSTAAAVLDRLLHHAHVISLKGDSYRLRSRLAPPKQTADSDKRG